MANALTVTRDRHWISPYFFSVFVSLQEKGIPFDVEAVNLHENAQRSDAYAKPTITARVPALFHRPQADAEPFVLAESSAIVEYLEDVFGPPAYPALLPTDVRERARARQIMAWIRSDDTLPIREHRSTHTMFYEQAKDPLPEGARAAAAKLCAVAERAIRSPEAPLGSTFSVADADLAFLLMRLVLNGDPVPERARRYAEHHWKRPSIRAFVEVERPAYLAY
ncbi:MAG: glutathione transferase [Polyangiaceae bacterium]